MSPFVIRALVAATFVIYVFLGFFLSWNTPFTEFPDEESHVQYAEYIAEHWRLPSLHDTAEAGQPPLYYILGAFPLTDHLSRPTIIYLLRLITLFSAVATLYLIWKIALLVKPGDSALAFLAVSFAAFNPQFIFTNAGVTNNSLAAFTCSLTFYLCLVYATTGTRLVWMGLSFGFAALTRQMAAFVFPVCFAAIYLQWLKSQRSSMLLLKRVAAFGSAAFVIAGWYYIRNWINYGDPFLYKLATTEGVEFLRKEPISFYYIIKGLAKLNASFWAYFGLHRYHAEIPEYCVYGLIEAGAAVGIFQLLRRKREQAQSYNRLALLMCLGAIVAALLQFTLLMLKIQALQGRYLFVAIAPISVVLGCGIYQLLPETKKGPSSVLVALFLLCFGIYLLSRYWAPHYL